MSDKSNKIIYLVSTVVLTVIVLMYAGNSIFNYEMFSERFAALDYPRYLIYPLTIAKILGLIAIWHNKSRTLKEWAYAGFFFDFILAMVAEAHADDGEYFSSLLATIALLTSYNISKNKGAKPVART
jgi:hypothetical protein